MDDGREIIAKIPNPNAGQAHFTTASEAATIDYVRLLLSAALMNANTNPYYRSEMFFISQRHVYMAGAARQTILLGLSTS